MGREEYTRKWSITYKGTPYRDIYGKKKAYDLLYELSKQIDNLEVVPSDREKPAPRAKRKPYNKRKRFQSELHNCLNGSRESYDGVPPPGGGPFPLYKLSDQ